jgi:membrane protein
VGSPPSTLGPVNDPISRAVGAARGLLRRQRARRPWLDHLVHAGGHYNRVQGDLLASGVTYYVFLALFPVVFLLASVAGFVLSGRPELLDRLTTAVRDAVPGQTGRDLADQVTSAIDSRGVVGLIGLVGFLFVGLGAMDKLRVGMDIIWRGRPDPPDFLADRLRDLVAVLGFGAAGVLSIALTTSATSASSRLLGLAGLDEVPGVFLLTGAVAIALALAGDTVVFLWLLKGVPGNPFGLRSLLPGAVFGAVGFEVLKLVGAWYLSLIASNVTAQALGSIVGLIVWINVVARFGFYTASWAATLPVIELARTPAVERAPVSPPTMPDPTGRPAPSPLRLALGLLGAGALAGVAATRWLPALLRRPGRERDAAPGAGPRGSPR